MRIGVICEGQTDFIAIETFLGTALKKQTIDAAFIPIQPSPDNTSDGGWARVLHWLQQNPPKSRVDAYLSGGLFAGNLSGQQCDVFVIQLDSDILGDAGFSAKLNDMGIKVNVPTITTERGEEIARILNELCNLGGINAIDQRKHILAPTVEASETWCIAAYEHMAGDPEELQAQALHDAFGSVLARSEGRVATLPYGKPDKSVSRRQSFCNRHKNSIFIELQATHFKQLLDKVVDLQN